jgi:hemerythrin-like metal-binding protein
LQDTPREIPTSGIEEVDAEHIALAAVITSLDVALKRNAPREELSGLLWNVVSLARAHFENEERAMERDRFPHLAEHRQRHSTLLHFAQSVATEFDAGRIDADQALIDEFWEWELSHIDGMDRTYWEFSNSSVKQP